MTYSKSDILHILFVCTGMERERDMLCFVWILFAYFTNVFWTERKSGRSRGTTKSYSNDWETENDTFWPHNKTTILLGKILAKKGRVRPWRKIIEDVTR